MPQQVLEIKERALTENESSDKNRPRKPWAQVARERFFTKLHKDFPSVKGLE